MPWTDYESDAARCEACKVCDTSRVRKLLGAGNRDAWIAIVGEGPGEQEEAQKENFVGRAGDMLDDCLDEAKLLRSEVWIENAVKGRCIAIVPTMGGGTRRANRKPTMKEIDACRGFLVASMTRLRPRVIVALGDVAITSLLGKQLGGVTEQRGRVIPTDVLGFPVFVIPSFHPAYALRVPAMKQFIVDDLKLAKSTAIANAPPGRSPSRAIITRTVGAVEAARDRIVKADRLVFDWETYGPVDDNGLHLISARGFCLSVSIASHEAYVFPRRLQGLAPAWSRRELQHVDDLLRDILTCKVEKGGFNVCAFDSPITASTLGKWPTNVMNDTSIANHMLNAHLGERANSLKIAAARYTDLGRYDDELDQWLIRNGYTREGKPDKTKLYLVDDAILHRYSGLDADAAYRLWSILDEKMVEEDVYACYRDQRIPIAREHGEIDRLGVRIDGRKLDAASADLEAGLAMVEAAIDEIAGRKINVNSHPQIAKLLFEQLGLSIFGRTETGQPATGEEFLMQIADQHEVVGMILQHRTFSKIKGTYVDGKVSKSGKPTALKSAVDRDGYARMNTRVAGPETLRFATRRPFAIHTFPKPVPRLPNIRALVIPSPGHKFVVSDYSQQEWAIASILANQQDMIEAILDRGEDVHELVARQLGGIAKEDYLDPVNGVKIPGDDAGLLWKSEDDFKTYKKARSKWKCVAPETKILKADLTWVEAQELREGDEVMGFDEYAPGNRGRRSYRRARVLSAGRDALPCVEVTTAKGTIVVSEDHRFLVIGKVDHASRQSDESVTALQNGIFTHWRFAKHLRPTDRIWFFHEPWESDQSYDAGWLAGFLDGEGSVTGSSNPDRSNFTVAFAQNAGPVADRAERLLKDFGVHHRLRQYVPKNLPAIAVSIPAFSALRLLGMIRPTRLLEKAGRIWPGLAATASRGSAPVPVLRRVRRLGVRPVITLATSTQTFIADGYLSHNSTNFTILFLGSAATLAKRLGCTCPPRDDRKPCDHEIAASNFISEYYERYSAIQSWQNQTKKYLRDHGHVRTPFGSVRRLPGIYDSNPSAQREAERQGCNAPIQMSGAHVMIRALLAIQSAFRRERFPGYSWARWRRGNPAQWFPGRVVASIHDELICEVRADVVDEGAAMIKACMEAPIPELRDRSLRVGQAIVDSWGG